MHRLALVALLAACTGTGQPDDVTIRPDTDPDPVYVGVAQVTPTALEIVDAPLEQRTTGSVELRNIDDKYELTLETATLPQSAGGVLSTDTETNEGRVLRAGDAYDILVVCAPTEAGEVTGTLRIETDDAENPIIDVPVTCRPAANDTDG